jgi:DHA1 family arabinose polymer transporter-like MFS transporter
MRLGLLALAIGAFGIGMTEFVMMGILPDIANALDISIPTAGHLVSAYALGVVLGAPLLVGLAGKYPPKKVLLVLMGLFTLFNGLSALAPNYGLMFVARLFSGLPHGAFFGVGAVVASRLADKGKEASSIALMFTGLTVSNILGVPLGTYIGHNFSWRITFVVVAVIGLFTLFSIKSWLPNLEANSKGSFRKDLGLFSRLEPWLIIGITAIGTGGLFAWFSYIVPLLTEVSKFGDKSITVILMLAGTGMAIGNIIGGKLSDKYSPVRATTWLLVAMMVCLIVMTFVATYQIPMLFMTFLTAAVAFGLSPSIQILMINAAKGSEMLASSTSHAAFNIGNALGAYLGGVPIAMGLGYTSPEWVGAALAFLGLWFAVGLNISQKKTTLTPQLEEVEAI